MSKRLASFGGPSAPSSTPVSGQSTGSTPGKKGGKNKPRTRDVTPSSPSPRPGPTSPRSRVETSAPSLGSRASVHAPPTASFLLKNRRASESPIQFLIRSTLKRAASELDEWESIVSRRGLKCAKLLVDTTTELENALSMLPSPGTQPRSRILGPKLKDLHRARVELQGYSADLAAIFTILTTRVAKLESALTEFVQSNGIDLAERSPVWNDRTWAFGQFVLHLARVLRPLNRSKYMIDMLIEQLTAYSLSNGSARAPAASAPSYADSLALGETQTSPGLNSAQAPTQGGMVPTFDQARTALVSWSADASRIGELITEWTETCEIEIVGWDEELGEESDEDEG